MDLYVVNEPKVLRKSINKIILLHIDAKRKFKIISVYALC